MNKINIQFGAAIIAAPIFVLIYNSIFQHQAIDVEISISDTKSFFSLLFINL